jgi:hypothetical protein
MTKPRKPGAFQFVERGPIRGEARMVRAGLALKDERVIRYQLLVNRFQQMGNKENEGLVYSWFASFPFVEPICGVRSLERINMEIKRVGSQPSSILLRWLRRDKNDRRVKRSGR